MKWNEKCKYASLDTLSPLEMVERKVADFHSSQAILIFSHFTRNCSILNDPMKQLSTILLKWKLATVRDLFVVDINCLLIVGGFVCWFGFVFVVWFIFFLRVLHTPGNCIFEYNYFPQLF